MKLAIVIPAYNEEKAISKVLVNLPKKIVGADEIVSIVVDDGSSDNTSKIAGKHSSYLVRHVVNLGVGAATITGLECAKKIKADMVITIDADGQHNPDDIECVVKPIIDNKADVVIGTRMINHEGMPALKIWGNHFMNLITFLIFQKWSSDSQSGMKAFGSKALKKMRFHSMGYEICSEIIGEIKRNKLKFVEVPIEVNYSLYSKIKGQDWLNGINIITKLLTIKMTNKK